MRMYIMLRDLQFIGHFTCQVFPFFNLMSIPVIIIELVPHLGSPLCVAVLEVLSETNLACVSCFFRFFGWRRLTINLVFSSIGLIFSEFFRNWKFCFILLIICGLLGLCVKTSGRVFVLLFLFFGARSSSCEKDVAFSTPFVIRLLG